LGRAGLMVYWLIMRGAALQAQSWLGVIRGRTLAGIVDQFRTREFPATQVLSCGSSTVIQLALKAWPDGELHCICVAACL